MSLLTLDGLPIVAHQGFSLISGSTHGAIDPSAQIVAIQYDHPGFSGWSCGSAFAHAANTLRFSYPSSAVALVYGDGFSQALTVIEGLSPRAIAERLTPRVPLGPVRVMGLLDPSEIVRSHPALRAISARDRVFAAALVRHLGWNPSQLTTAVEGCAYRSAEEHLRRFNGECPGCTSGDVWACLMSEWGAPPSSVDPVSLETLEEMYNASPVGEEVGR